MIQTFGINTPHGQQFGRDAAEFADDTVNPNLWDDALSERSFEAASIQAEIDQLEAHANDPAAHVEQTVAEARTYATPTRAEREADHERDVYNTRVVAHVGRLNRFSNRDRARSVESDMVAGGLGFFKSKQQKQAGRVARMSERQLVQAESEIGKTLFGPVGKGARREFFNLDEDTWIWHEEWADAKDKPEARTTRYQVRGDEVVKSQDGEKRSYATGAELQNLMLASRLYYDRVTRAVYHRDPATGQRLVDIL